MALFAIDNDDDARRGGVVEKVLRQQDHRLDQIAFHESLANVPLAVGTLVAAAPTHRARVQHHRHTALLFQRGQHVLQPAPIRAGSGRDAQVKTFVGVVLVQIRRKVLVPHGIGGDQIKGHEAAGLIAKGGVAHGVAQANVGLHVVDHRIHARHGEGGRVDFLAKELKRRMMGRQPAVAVLFLSMGLQQAEVTLDEQPARSAARVVDGHARLGLQDAGHEHGHLARGVELARALALALGELAQQVLVGAAQDVGFHITQAQAMAREYVH